MKAFVTGATGLLGNNLVRLLIEQGYEVKALVRSQEKAEKVFGNLLQVEFVAGDMEAVENFASELEGCDVLFHTAAYFREYYQPGDHWTTLENINVKGTLKILEEAEKHGVKKAIYVSSSGIIGLKPNGEAGDENTPPHPEADNNLYFKSKVLADKAVADFCRSHRLEVVQILPGWMLGLGDIAPTASGQLILDYLNKKLPGSFDGGTATVDARDVAQAMISAVERGKNGEKYIVGGKFATLAQINETLEKVSGIPAPKLKIPNFLISAYAAIAELYGRLTGKAILTSRSGVATMQAKLDVSSAKAVRELGVKFRSLEETLRDEVEWYRQNGFAS